MKRIALLTVLALIAGVSCGRMPGQKKPAVYGVAGVDYGAIDGKARTFIPVAGQRGGTIAVAVSEVPETFNPVFSVNGLVRQVAGLMYAGLTRFDPVRGTVIPALARSWEASADSLVWTFHLGRETRWSDSTPVTAQDVEFTYNRIILNDSVWQNAIRDMFMVNGEKISFTAVDSFTVRVTLPSRFAPILAVLEQPVFPRHIFEKPMRSTPFSAMLGSKLNPAQLVGSGPFILASYAPSQKVVMTRNRHYWRRDTAGIRLPYADTLRFQIIPSQNEQYIAFTKGEIGTLSARTQDYNPLMENNADGGYAVHCLGPVGNSPFLVLNVNPGRDSAGRPYVDSAKRAWFANENFRRAVSHAVNRDGIIRTVFSGMGYPQWSPAGLSGARSPDSGIAASFFDTALSRRILSAEGFRDLNKDGTLEDRNGVPVAFSLATPNGNVLRAKIGECIVKDLAVLGMKVDLQTRDIDDIDSNLTRPPFGWETALVSMDGAPDPLSDVDLWRSSGSYHLWNPAQKTPATAWERSIDTLFDLAVSIYATDGRDRIRHAWQRIVSQHVPVIYTAVPERIICVSSKLGNINPSLTAGIFDNIDEVFVVKQAPVQADTVKTGKSEK